MMNDLRVYVLTWIDESGNELKKGNYISYTYKGAKQVARELYKTTPVSDCKKIDVKRLN